MMLRGFTTSHLGVTPGSNCSCLSSFQAPPTKIASKLQLV